MIAGNCAKTARCMVPFLYCRLSNDDTKYMIHVLMSCIFSAAELFRLNTGRSLSVKRKKGGKNGKTRVISTTSIVEAAATKLTDMHNSKQSAGASKSKDLSMSSSLNPQHKSSPTPVIEKDFLYKGTRYPFTSQHFKSDTKQWRLIFLFHNFLDVEVGERE